MNANVIALLPYIGALLAPTVAIILWYLNQRSQLQETKRTRQLDRLNQQLSKLYGPLSTLYETGERQWLTFVKEYSNDPMPEPEFKRFFAEQGNTNAPGLVGLKEFRRWVTATFMPNNTRMEEVIINNGDLVVGRMPQCLLDLCVHVAAYKPVVKRWEEGDFNEHEPADHQVAYQHPGFALREYVRAAVKVVKKAQEDLLNRNVKSIMESQLDEKIEEEILAQRNARERKYARILSGLPAVGVETVDFSKIKAEQTSYSADRVSQLTPVKRQRRKSN